MNTRSFIRSLVIGCVAPTIFIPRFEGFKWKRCANEARNLWIPNPAWETAEYEIEFRGPHFNDLPFPDRWGKAVLVGGKFCLV